MSLLFVSKEAGDEQFPSRGEGIEHGRAEGGPDVERLCLQGFQGECSVVCASEGGMIFLRRARRGGGGADTDGGVIPYWRYVLTFIIRREEAFSQDADACKAGMYGSVK